MSERNSEYARQAGDTYVTPRWVYDALYAVERFDRPWDCAPVDAGFDFLEMTVSGRDIVTNPPYSLAEKFIRHALDLNCITRGKVAMLLPMAFDSAKGRRDLFEKPPFKAKYTITTRIRWENLEQKKAGPSMNHAWFVWDWKHERKPFCGYLPRGRDSDIAPFTSIGDAASSVVNKLRAKMEKPDAA